MNVDHDDAKEKRKRGKSKRHSDSSSHDESDVGKDAPKRKRGRPRTVKRDDVEGFTDQEVRRYEVNFYPKFKTRCEFLF